LLSLRSFAHLGAALALAAAGCDVATHGGPTPPISLPTVQGGTFTLAEHRGEGPVAGPGQ
jgi:hypothetical protein